MGIEVTFGPFAAGFDCLVAEAEQTDAVFRCVSETTGKSAWIEIQAPVQLPQLVEQGTHGALEGADADQDAQVAVVEVGELTILQAGALAQALAAADEAATVELVDPEVGLSIDAAIEG